METTAVGCPAVAEHEDKIPVNTTKAKGGVEVELHCFLTLAPSGGEWSASLHTKATLLSAKSPKLTME